jgi:hypothetical protein
MNLLATSDIVSDMNTLATSSNVTAMSNCSDDISNINTVSGSISNVNTAAGSISNINTVATNINSVNDFSDRYRVSASAPTTSLHDGDLWFDTTADTLKIYNATASAWQAGATETSGFVTTAGATMTGQLTTITPTSGGHATNKTYVDGTIDTKIDSALTGDIVGGTGITVSDNTPGSGQITVAVTAGSIGASQLASTAVTAGSYGSSSAIPSITVDADGRITAASTSSIDSTAITNGTSNVSVANNGEVTVVRAGSQKLTTKSDGVDVTGEVQCDTLDVDGSANFSGDVQVGGDPYSETGVDIRSIGLVKAARVNATDSLWAGYTTGNSSATSEIFANGSASFGVNASTYQTGVNINHSSNLSTLTVYSANSSSHRSFVVYDNAQSGDARYRASINADGSASFAGNVTLNANLDMQDNDKILLGTGDDLEIYHDGSNSYINETGTGGLIVKSGDVYIRNPSNQDMIHASSGSFVKLYHNSSKKLETKSDGVGITGELECDTLDLQGNLDIHATRISYDTSSEHLKFLDNIKLVFGNGNDLQIYHDGSHSYVRDVGTGDLRLASDGTTAITKGTSEMCAGFNVDGAVELYYDNSNKLQTKADGVNITGQLQCTDLDVNGPSDFENDATFRGGANAVNIAANSDIRLANGNWTGNTTSPKIQAHNSQLYICGGPSGIVFRENGSDRAYFDGSGHFRPGANNTYDLGISSARWRNVYTNDLNLSNEGSTNDVDGTWGSFTIQEGEDDLFLINRRSGKKYKFNLTEVN